MTLAFRKQTGLPTRDILPSAKVYGAKDAEKAMTLAAEVDPQLVFVESAGPNLDGMAFTRAYRRGDHDCREAPIIMIFADVSGLKADAPVRISVWYEPSQIASGKPVSGCV